MAIKYNTSLYVNGSLKVNDKDVALKEDLTKVSGDVSTLQSVVEQNTNNIALKAAQSDLEALQGTVTSNSEALELKAAQSDLEAAQGDIEDLQQNKADAQTVTNLSATVDSKADKSVVDALSETVDSKADKTSLESLATKQELTDAIAGVTQFEYEKVDELPVTGDKGIIYLVLEDGEYSEYIWIGDAFEQFGPAIDLSGYQTDQEAEAALSLKADKTAVEALSGTVDTKADKTVVDNLTTTVNEKADKTAVEALSETVDTKADAQTVTDLTATVDNKANSADVYTKTEVDTKVAHNHYEVTNLDSITGMKEGDTAIVKVSIKDGETEDKTIYSHTAYIYDEGAWKALDGNYNADNVYIDEDITFAGDWTKVGNVAIDSTIKTKGMSLSTLLTTIFTQELDGAAKTNPYYEVTRSGNTATVEAGATFNPKFTISKIETGAYTYGSNAPDGVSTGVTFTDFTGTASGGVTETIDASSDAVNGTVTFTSVTAEDGKSYTYKISATRNAAQYVAVTNLGSATKVGSDTTPGYSFAAASNVSPSANGSFTVTGDRYTWYGDVTTAESSTWNPEALTATQVKSLANKQWTDVTGINKKTFNTREGMIKMFICAPSGKYSSISLTQKSPELTITLTKATNKVTVPGAGTDAGVEYDVFYYSGDAGYGSTNTMTINAA